MTESGLVLSLPDPKLDIDDDDPAKAPVVIKGEPLSETIVSERRSRGGILFRRSALAFR
jgi:hypothetical protein